MASARKIEDETEARRCLRAAKLAGLSAGEWARARGIDGRSLNAWRMNLAGRGAPRTTAAPRRRPTPPRAAHALVELVPAAASAKDVAGGRYVLEVAGASDLRSCARLCARRLQAPAPPMRRAARAAGEMA